MATNNLMPASINALTDVANRGLVAGTLGLPVDMATMLMRPFGYAVDKPTGGSEWIGQKMEDFGVVSPTRRPLAELAAGFALPASASIKTMMYAAKDAQAARKATQAAATAEENLQGLTKAQENNTFKFDRGDMSKGYGRRMGYPQPVGTSSDKLFSNFADEIKKPDLAANFRENILNRALANPKAFEKDKVLTTTLPFKNDMSLVIEAANEGGTRVQVIKDGMPVAAARLKNGLLDSIGVHESAKGQQIGSDLLEFIYNTKIGNALEVPDRSPGFIKIQKELVKKIENP
jgi:hypothetical protein